MKKLTSLIFGALIAVSASTVFADIVSDSGSAVDTHADGGSDYFGQVVGGEILGQNFNSSINPPELAFAGEDLNGNVVGGVQTSETACVNWDIALPGNALPGTGLTNIDFSGLLAASSSAWDTNSGNTLDFIDFEFFVNGSSTGLLEYRPIATSGSNSELALDSDANGVGDGPVLTATGSSVVFSDAGGVLVTSASVKMTVRADSGGEEFWTNGTLSADFQAAVPEPSSLALLGLASLGLVTRRRRS
jgi:hypothetical protein